MPPNTREKEITHLPLLIFFILLIIFLQRLLFNIYFFSRYGAHSCYVTELWFYKGVGEGIFKLAVFDPTLWLMRIIHFVFGPRDYYAIIGSGVLLILLTGLLVFFIARKLAGVKAGIVALVLYLTLYAPTEWNVASFTHDLVQLPVLLTVLLVFSCSRTRPGLWFLLLPLFALGFFIGPMIFIALLIIILFFLTELVRKKNNQDKFLYLICLSSLLLVLIVFKSAVAPGLLTMLQKGAAVFRGIDLSLQIYHGSKDLLPVTQNVLFENFKYLWVFIFLGFFAAYQRRDLFAPLLFLVPLMVSLLFTRAIRYLDIGGVILAAYAIADWFSNRLERKTAWFIFIIIFAYSIAKSNFAPFVMESALFCLLLLGFLYLALRNYWLKRHLLVIILGLIFIMNTIYAYSFLKRKVALSLTEAEYNAACYLRENSSDNNGLLLTDWDLGYPFMVISGHEVVSSPGRLNRDTGSIFWRDLDQARQELNRQNIRYIIISTKEFHLVSMEPSRDFVVYATGLSSRPQINRLSDLQKTLVYNLIALEDTSSLQKRGISLIYEETDRYMKHRVRLFEIKGDRLLFKKRGKNA